MKIMKFGGSSVADSECIKRVADIIEMQENFPIIVLSAMKGITNKLLAAASSAAEGKSEYKKILNEIESAHYITIDQLFVTGKDKIKEKISLYLRELREFLHGIELIQECSLRSQDLISSFGERMSCRIVSEFLNEKGRNAQYIDARKIILTDDSFSKAKVDFNKTAINAKKYLSETNTVYIVTGFIASTHDGITTTLGRNGSDYTASILGSCLHSESVEIWTDVDGILSADPRVVKDAYVIPELNIQEAMEMAYFGAEVIHPFTLMPLVEKNIPVVIKNTFNPAAPGTSVVKEIEKRREFILTGLASIDDITLINIEGSGMVGVPGMASIIFQSLAKENISIIMISQASSEHSICLACRSNEAKKAISVLKNDLEDVLANGVIQEIQTNDDNTIIAAIGENMKGTPGISGRIFSSLGNAKINILAIAQGSSERNISFVIKKIDKDKALNTIHDSFLA